MAIVKSRECEGGLQRMAERNLWMMKKWQARLRIEQAFLRTANVVYFSVRCCFPYGVDIRHHQGEMAGCQRSRYENNDLTRLLALRITIRFLSRRSRACSGQPPPRACSHVCLPLIRSAVSCKDKNGVL